MDAASPVRLHRLRYSVRGPEWAFAIPQGDLDVLVEVMTRCCEFWNGVNSLIVPVAKNGRVPRAIRYLVESRPCEQLFVHSAVPEDARDTLVRRFPAVTNLWDRFDERERHPLSLWTSQPTFALHEPELSGTRLARIKLATWGTLGADDRQHWERLFGVDPIDRSVCQLGALLDMQIAGQTPLLLTARHMSVFESSIGHERHIWFFGQANFTELVNFWNCRSRMGSFHIGPRLVGAPRELLEQPELLEPVVRWATTPSALQVQPSILASVDARDEAAAHRAFTTLGFKRYDGNKLQYHFGRDAPAGEPQYQLAGPMLSGPMKRGVPGSALITITQPETSLSLPIPPGFEATGGGKIRLQLHNFPLPFPLNQRLAQAVFPVAIATSDGIVWAVEHTRDRWDFDVALPEGWEALRLWAEGKGYEAGPSQPGRYGQALLGRIQSSGLQILGTDETLAVLDQLVPLSAKKLARHLVELSAGKVDENRIASALRQEPLWMELQSRTLGEICAGAGMSKKRVLPALSALVEAGFLVRGRALRCPICNYRDWHALRELDERMRCRACSTEWPLPASDSGGTREADSYYRLDGLMARCMDQDLLPVLLALRSVQRLASALDVREAWPGVLFRRGNSEQDIDLLISTGAQVTVFECKARAETLQVADARSLVQIARQLAAVPAVAALDGKFLPGVRKVLTNAGGVILERRHLLEPEAGARD